MEGYVNVKYSCLLYFLIYQLHISISSKEMVDVFLYAKMNGMNFNGILTLGCNFRRKI